MLWITGPPGCGKTTLVSSYIEFRRLPCLWYKVDEGDADLSTFFYYLGLAAAKAAQRRRRRLPLLTPERMPGLAVFAQRYFEALSGLLPIPSLLVLDDCHRIQEDCAFFETLQEGIPRLAPGVGTVFISRSGPHPFFARDRANRLMQTIGWEDLRLTLEETTGIVELQGQGDSSSELVRDLFGRTDGWVAGLLLLLEGTDKARLPPRQIGREVPAEIRDYFGSEIFRRLDPERRDFLLRTAFLPRMTEWMAEQLTGLGRAGAILSEMHRHNRFTKKYPQREPVYEYHDLFREFLLAQASEEFSRDERAGVRKAAAVLLARAGYVENAVGLFREGEDWEALSRLILSQARSLVSQGRYQTVLEWLGALPKAVLEGDPWLTCWKGVCLIPFSPAESQALFEVALEEFDRRRDASGVFRCWVGVVESIITPMENLTRLDSCISRLPRLLETYGGLPAGEVGDEVTCWMFRALSYRQHPRAAVDLWTSRALALAQATTDEHLKFTLNLGFLVAFLVTRDTREANRLFNSLREAIKQPDAAPLMRLSVDHLQAVCLVLSGEYERCLQVTTAGLALAKDTGVHVVDAFLQAYGAAAALNLGDTEIGYLFLEQMAVTLDSMKPLPLGQYHHLVASEALQRNDLAKAAFHARECLRLWEESGFATHFHAGWILAAHVHHALREDEDAFRLVTKTRRHGEEVRNFYGIWASYLSEAYFHLQRNDEGAAIPPLQIGLRVGRESGLFGASIRLRDMFQKVSVKALEEGIEVEYVKELIRRNRLEPDPANPDLGQWPWPVKVYTLGRFGLLVDDRPVEFGRKVQQKPLALLKALVALGGREIPMGRLADLLWPDADGDRALKALEAALGRLRKLLRKTDALELKAGCLSLSRRHCWVDVWSFERSVGRAEKARKEGSEQEFTRLSEKALSLYRGPFLPFEDVPWALPPRERLRARFLASVERLGKVCENAGRWEEAASCYGRGLEADELAEEFYRRLMVCHIRRGREAEAVAVYRRCRRTLSSVIGVRPSAETRAIAASLGPDLR